MYDLLENTILFPGKNESDLSDVEQRTDYKVFIRKSLLQIKMNDTMMLNELTIMSHLLLVQCNLSNIVSPRGEMSYMWEDLLEGKGGMERAGGIAMLGLTEAPCAMRN